MTLLLKLVLAPALVVASSLAGRRWGPGLAGALVLAVTGAAPRLGAGLTGVLAPFPTGTSVVVAFALAQGGPAAAVATARGVLRGLWGFAVFCFLTAVLAEPLGAPAFVLATLGALGTQLVLRLISAGSRDIGRARPADYT